jgi:hypothetical protein
MDNIDVWSINFLTVQLDVPDNADVFDEVIHAIKTAQ